MNILSEEPVTMAFVKKELAKIKKRDKELSFRSAKTEEYLQDTAPPKGADALAEKLNALKIPRLKEQHIIKIIDILPKTLRDVKVVLQNYTITVTNENMKKIAETVKEATE